MRLSAASPGWQRRREDSTLLGAVNGRLCGGAAKKVSSQNPHRTVYGFMFFSHSAIKLHSEACYRSAQASIVLSE